MHKQKQQVVFFLRVLFFVEEYNESHLCLWVVANIFIYASRLDSVAAESGLNILNISNLLRRLFHGSIHSYNNIAVEGKTNSGVEWLKHLGLNKIDLISLNGSYS